VQGAGERDALGRTGVLGRQNAVPRGFQVQPQKLAQRRGLFDHEQLGHDDGLR
jgi:hypothetical protein